VSRSIRDRLAESRARQFVGRNTELALFSSLLESKEACTLFLHGPGGVGKSTLLQQLRLEAEQRKLSCTILDGRDLAPTSDAFRSALPSPLPAVLLIDTYELLAPIDEWIFEELLPSLPESTLVVIAGRDPPAARWRTDPGWSEILRAVALANFDRADAARLLEARGVPAHLFARAHEVTHGHPLALALVAELAASDAESALVSLPPDAVGVLLRTLLRHVPSELHREALEACAMLRTTTEDLLRDLYGEASAELFSWLRSLSFVQEGLHGLFPHDLARDVIDRELSWRDPTRHRALRSRIGALVGARLRHASAATWSRAFRDSLWLWRHDEVVGSFFDWRAHDLGTLRPAHHDDLATILSLVRRHEGPEAERIAAHWWSRQPEAFTVFEHARELVGFIAYLDLERIDPTDRELDPAIAAAERFLEETAPLRPGEHLTHLRFWVDRDSLHDERSPTHHLLSMRVVSAWLTGPPGWTVLAISGSERWREFFESIDFHPAPSAGFEVGGRRYRAFAHDWRAVPPETWFERGRDSGEEAPELTVLSREEFDAAVRRALRDLERDVELASNPLLASRVARRSSPQPTPDDLRRLIEEAAQTLAGHPKDEKLLRALEVTYLDPSPTQEAAAERLGIPFSTYRRHLGKGVERIVEHLWRAECLSDA
jgi:hypothetical protein